MNIQEKYIQDNHFDKINVFVNCGGKCGGTTLAASIQNAGFNVLHTHNINNVGLFSHGVIDLKKANLIDLIHYNKKIHKKIIIIDCYRNIIERKISSFFQNIILEVPDYKSISIHELISIFNQKYLSMIENYNPINQLLTTLGQPKMKTFNFQKKYEYYQWENIHFYKIRFNDIPFWSQILNDIFGMNIPVINHNDSGEKEYKDIYRDFFTQYKIPRDYFIDKIMYHEDFLIYNTPEDKKNYIKKWWDKIDA